jgi:hypothetical protein
MTEAEWMIGTRPTKLLPTIRGRASNRKLRLFACACCRRMWEWMTEADQRRQVEVAEAHADGRATTDEFLAAFSNPDLSRPFVVSYRHLIADATGCLGWSDAEQPDWKMNETAQAITPQPWGVGAYAEFCTARVCMHASQAVGYREGKPYTPFPDRDRLRAAADHESGAQATILRDIFGNPFRPATLDPTWRTQTAVLLARGMYESRDFGAIPILADALQDAGCDSDDVLNHCRGPGPHVRGCWVVDLVLGKT